jgi:hypothetical protein
VEYPVSVQQKVSGAPEPATQLKNGCLLALLRLRHFAARVAF